VAQVTSPNDAIYELGKLYQARCDFGIAIKKYKEAAEGYVQERNFDMFLKCQNNLLIIFAAREDSEAIRQTKERLQDLVLNEGFELTARTYYTLGVCASHKSQHDVAIEYYQKSLALALAADEKPSICWAIHGLGYSYYSLDRLPEALKEIYNLQVFFQVLDIPELKLASQMLNGHVLRKMKKYEQAIEILWNCYDLVREQKSMYLYLSLMYGLALAYKDSGELDMARMYLKLARKSSDPENLRYLCRHIDSLLHDLGGASEEDYDLIFDPVSNAVTEKKKGRVDFKNQFILLDMLRLFMNQPGAVYSKELLVKQVWKQDYNPSVHDNKIYVTIKRLRKLIEPDYDKPKYIFRAKNGYYLNKNAKVLMEAN
jgi:tetratricopeptide (TPR) repeat protein